MTEKLNKYKEDAIFYIPGGPCITGSYWDYFINNFSIDCPSFRHRLFNHEEDYKDSEVGSFDLMIEKLINELEVLSKDFNLNVVAHSFGGVLLNNLPDEVLMLINSAIFLNAPASKYNQDFIRLIGTEKKLTDNISFSQFYKEIFNLYFAKEKNAINFINYTQDIFYKNNENIDYQEKDYKSLKNLFPVLVVNSENDIVIKPIKDKEFEEVILPNSGHFPMLENPIELREIIVNFIQRRH